MSEGIPIKGEPDLPTVLGLFAGQVNTHPHLRGLLGGWSPDFFIEASDNGQRFRVVVDGGRIPEVRSTLELPDDDALLLRATTRVLVEVFGGRRSALGAYTDGALEVYGPQKDQTKLDALALVLWPM